VRRVKNAGKGRRGAKRRKNAEKRAVKTREMEEARRRARRNLYRRQDKLAASVRAIVVLSRVGLVLDSLDSHRYQPWAANADGVGLLDIYGNAPFRPTFTWRELCGFSLSSAERAVLVPYLPKSPLERLAECAEARV